MFRRQIIPHKILLGRLGQSWRAFVTSWSAFSLRCCWQRFCSDLVRRNCVIHDSAWSCGSHGLFCSSFLVPASMRPGVLAIGSVGRCPWIFEVPVALLVMVCPMNAMGYCQLRSAL